MNYYEVLGVGSTATASEIKKAYRKLARKYHPDRFVQAPADVMDEAVARFKRGEEAYRILKDPTRRAYYDSTGTGDMPNEEDAAVKKVIQAFHKHVKSALEKELQRESLDIFSSGLLSSTGSVDRVLPDIRSELKDAKSEVGTSIDALTEGVAKLNKYKRSVTSKGESNLYLMVVEQKLSATSGALAAAGVELGVLERALAMLDDYEFVADAVEESGLLMGGSQSVEGAV